jgi:phosphate starvation-inducible PhoH-like protein
MASETLHFDNARQAQSLYASEPKNLRLVEDLLNLKVTARDGWINVEGSVEDIARAKNLFTELHQAVSHGTVIRRQEFSRAVSAISRGEALKMQELHEGRVDVSTRKRPIIPKTQGQNRYLEAIRKNDIVIGIGPAGTGKTYLAVAVALAALRDGRASRLILTRPAVEAGEALGFLPGDLYEKITPYLRPLQDALHDMLPAEEIQRHTERGTIEIAPLAYMRGRTLNNAFIILDEAQNSTTEQMLMFLTRLGHGSKAVITGDETQIDLPPNKHSGLLEAHRVLKNVEGIAVVEFSRRDVVRHPLVQRIIAAYEEHRGGVKT